MFLSKTIFFDYDGTIHDSFVIYAPALRKAVAWLVDGGHISPMEIDDDLIRSFLGKNPMAMWQEFLPDVEVDVRQKASAIVSLNMNQMIEDGLAIWYPNAKETLLYLRDKGYRLIFISNCKTYYKEAHDKVFNLSALFDQLLASEDFNYISKEAIIDEVMGSFELPAIVIGDRLADITAGRAHGFKTIGCLYGYGSKDELKDADVWIDDIAQLKDLM